MRKLLALLALAGAAAAAGAAGLAPRLLGKVVRVAEGAASFELRTRAGTFEVEVAGSAPVAVHRAVPLRDLPDGTLVHILGRKQAPSRDPTTGASTGPLLVNMIAIVAAERFEPPPLPSDLEGKRLEWISGGLSVHPSKAAFSLAGYGLAWGPERPVLRIETAERAVVAKGKTVLVECAAEPDRKAKKAAAKKVDILAPDVPGDVYRAAFGI